MVVCTNYALWQFFCGSGGSGSSKLNMSREMPVIYNIILVVIQKVMNITEKEAATALSTCLKTLKTELLLRNTFQNTVVLTIKPAVALMPRSLQK